MGQFHSFPMSKCSEEVSRPADGVQPQERPRCPQVPQECCHLLLYFRSLQALKYLSNLWCW